MELVSGHYKALEEDFLKHFAGIKKDPLEKVLIITQSRRLNHMLKERLLSSKECLSCVFWQDILGLVSSINQASKNYVPLKQKTALDYFKLKDFLQKHNFNSSPGYVKALQSSFMDMQNALIMPQDLLKIEEFSSALFSKELKDLIFIYQNYLNLTQVKGKLSYQDFFVAALDNIENNEYLAQFKQIIFYGIYDLTTLQYDILKAVSQNYNTVLFFPYENLASYKYIQDFYLANILGLASKHTKTALPKSELETFAEHLFAVDSKEENKKYKAPIKIINTSASFGEVACAAKEVLLLHKQGFAFKDIALCARSLEPYKNDIVQIFKLNNIPININFEEPFLSKPLINLCSSLLNIARNNFNKDIILSFIGSPYIKNRHKLWGQLIKDIGVQTGFDQWMTLIDLAILQGRIGARELKDFLVVLEAKARTLEAAGSFVVLVARVRDIFDTFIDFEKFSETEQKLFDTFEGILKEICTFDQVRPCAKNEFLEELNYLLEQEKINFAINLENSLTVADTMNLRGQAFKAIIILGLNEGVFPARVNEDPVFKDYWRSALQKLGYNIKVSVQRYYEEKLFFYLALSAASDKAILIFQRSDSEGKTKIPSLYLNWVYKLALDIESFSLSRRPAEQLLEWYKIAPSLLTPQEAALFTALQGNFALAAQLLNKADSELFLQAFKLSVQEALTDRDLLVKPQNLLWQHIKQKGISPTALSNLFQCPAKYFFDNLLDKQDTTVLKRDQLDFRERGTKTHLILEQFYKHLAKNNLFEKLSPKGALEILQSFIEDNLKVEDYKKHGLYPLLWLILRREMKEKLETFVEKDLIRIEVQKQKPEYFEKDIICSFGDLNIHGKIDRIDVSCDKTNFSVIDYKSGKIEGRGSKIIFKEASVQAPFYFELAQTLAELKTVQPNKMLYASLKDSSFKEITYDEYLTFKDTFWSLTKFLTELAKEGLFIITPWEKACKYCAYGEVCRKNHEFTRRRAAFSRQAGKLREYRLK